MAKFRTAFYKFMPSWLYSDEGELVNYSLGVIMDAFLERLWLGVRARMPSYAPPDAFPRLGRDRKIVRGINEGLESYAVRLIRWLDDHLVRGNPYALLEQLRAYCNVDMMARVVDARGNWFTIDADGVRSFSLAQANWDWGDNTLDGSGNITNWGRFWVVLYPPTTLWTQTPAWGDPALWGGAWGTDGYTWGSTATPSQVAAVRSIVRDWKPAGTRCEYIILAFDPSSFDPTDVQEPVGDLPGGDWTINHRMGSDPAVAARLETASYWPGPT